MSGDQEHKYGKPVGEFITEGKQKHITEMVSQHIKAANDMIKHARENFGATVELFIRQDEQLIDALISFPKETGDSNG